MIKKIAYGLTALIILAALALVALVWSLTRPPAPMEQGPVATLAQGEISAGIDRDNASVLQFNGIPFAAAPVGDLRWTAPAPAAGWTEVRDGRDFGAECLQARAGSGEFIRDITKGLGLSWPVRQLAALVNRYSPPPVESEDCLFLNVRTANFEQDTLQPVMVWIHGGSHQSGAGSDTPYQANGLVENGVVLVTVNYRLGPFGYLAHPALSAADPRGVSGNYGLLDQIAALEWVRDNIEVFGGDPNNVTIFGESAGAQSVTEIMASPLGNGLYNKTILQSGSSTYNALGLEAAIPGRMTMHQAGLEFMEGLAEDNVTAADLRALPAADVISQIEAKGELRSYMLPNVDGVVLPRLIGEAIRDGHVPAVPMLAGYNDNEATLFYGDIQSPTVLKSPFPESHADRLAELVEIYGDADATRLMNVYNLKNEETYERGAIDMLGDDLFGFHMRFLGARNASAGQPTWMYHFERIPPSPKQTIGAFHASEIFFVFNSHVPLMEVTEEDEVLTEQMGQYWTNFAKTGNPNGEGLPDWPTYGEDVWMAFTPDTAIRSDLNAVSLDIMERVLLERLEAASPLITPPPILPETSLVSGDEETGAEGLQP